MALMYNSSSFTGKVKEGESLNTKDVSYIDPLRSTKSIAKNLKQHD